MEFNEFEERMEKTISVFEENLSEIRAGRANPAILNKITVNYYGTATPINQVAGISVPEARLIVIQPWDVSLLKEIEKEILKADIGINPNNDGKVIRLAFPELNEERRKEIVKDIRKLAEEAKISIRAIRRDGIDSAKIKQKNSEITEDDLKNAETQMQKLTDKKIEEIINGNKLYIIDISSTCYIVDEITGEILDYNFEDMDEYQTYQYFEDGDKKIIFITENQNNQLTVKEIIESVIELF